MLTCRDRSIKALFKHVEISFKMLNFIKFIKSYSKKVLFEERKKKRIGVMDLNEKQSQIPKLGNKLIKSRGEMWRK